MYVGLAASSMQGRGQDHRGFTVASSETRQAAGISHGNQGAGRVSVRKVHFNIETVMSISTKDLHGGRRGSISNRFVVGPTWSNTPTDGLVV